MRSSLARPPHHSSRYSTQIPSPKPSFYKTRLVAKYAGYLCLSSVFGVSALVTGILIHDAFTYNEKHIDRVPVSPLALHPGRGGPKNLPVARVQVDDEEDEENKRLAEKPKLVIIGGGWGVCRCAFPLKIQLTVCV